VEMILPFNFYQEILMN